METLSQLKRYLVRPEYELPRSRAVSLEHHSHIPATELTLGVRKEPVVTVLWDGKRLGSPVTDHWTFYALVHLPMDWLHITPVLTLASFHQGSSQLVSGSRAPPNQLINLVAPGRFHTADSVTNGVVFAYDCERPRPVTEVRHDPLRDFGR